MTLELHSISPIGWQCVKHHMSFTVSCVSIMTQNNPWWCKSTYHMYWGDCFKVHVSCQCGSDWQNIDPRCYQLDLTLLAQRQVNQTGDSTVFRLTVCLPAHHHVVNRPSVRETCAKQSETQVGSNRFILQFPESHMSLWWSERVLLGISWEQRIRGMYESLGRWHFSLSSIQKMLHLKCKMPRYCKCWYVVALWQGGWDWRVHIFSSIAFAQQET